MVLTPTPYLSPPPSLSLPSFVLIYLHSIPQFPHLTTAPDYQYKLPVDAKMDEICIYFQTMQSIDDWSVLNMYSEGDAEFEYDLLDSYMKVLKEEKE
jgi:hypothetical protein